MSEFVENEIYNKFPYFHHVWNVWNEKVENYGTKCTDRVIYASLVGIIKLKHQQSTIFESYADNEIFLCRNEINNTKYREFERSKGHEAKYLSHHRKTAQHCTFNALSNKVFMRHRKYREKCSICHTHESKFVNEHERPSRGNFLQQNILRLAHNIECSWIRNHDTKETHENHLDLWKLTMQHFIFLLFLFVSFIAQFSQFR